MGDMGRRKRTKWVQLVAACALLLMLAPFAQQTDRGAWLSTLQVSAASAKAPAAPVREDALVREDASTPSAEQNADRASLSGSVSVELAAKR